MDTVQDKAQPSHALMLARKPTVNVVSRSPVICRLLSIETELKHSLKENGSWEQEGR